MPKTRSVTGRSVSPQFITGLTGLYFVIPICVQGILLVRILATYPPRVISRLLAFAIYGTLLAMMLARAINIGVAIQKISNTTRMSGNLWTATTFEEHVPSLKVELCMTLAYDMYELSLLPLRPHSCPDDVRQHRFFVVPLPSPSRRRAQDQEQRVRSGEPRGRPQYVRHSLTAPRASYASYWPVSYAARLRALFWIALTNFVLPVIFNTLLLIFVVKDENFANIIAVIAVSSVNVYVQITSVLLATLWCSATRPEVSSGYPGDSRSRLRESVPKMQFVPQGLVSLPTRSGVQVTRTSSLEELA